MNNDFNRALLYFPTSVLFVDDDPIFLSNIGFKIDKRIPVRLSDNPREALAMLRATPLANEITQRIFTTTGDENDFGVDLHLTNNIKLIHQEIYNQNRFSNISTLVIDYSMPCINGAEFCSQISDLPIKKIMLTGEADHATAVELFNNGLIDSFIVKDSSNMADEISIAIKKAQHAYFAHASRVLIEYLSKTSPFFNPSIFENLLKMQLSKDEFSEYYIVDGSGSMLFIDFDGKESWVIIKSSKEIENYYDIAVDQQVSEDIIKSLNDKLVIPFFLTDADYKLPASKWMPYLHPAYKVHGIEDYYYAVISDSSLYALEKNKILSHHRYLLT